MISDAYIERLIEKSDGEIIELLEKKYKPKENMVIDCKNRDRKRFYCAIKEKFKFIYFIWFKLDDNK